MKRVPDALLVAAAAVFAGAFLWVAVSTLGYPFQLEWMEGGVVQVVQRVLEGKPLYTAPGLGYVPYIYPPAYFYAAAAVSTVTGAGFLGPRIVSLLATVGTAILIARFVRKEGAARPWGMVGAGLFLATFVLSGCWFHLARVDSLQVFWLVAAAYALRFGSTWRAALLAGMLGALAVLTKQTSIVALGPVLLVAVAQQGRRGLIAVATLAAVAAGVLVALDVRSGGWLRYYVWVVPALHRMDGHQLAGLVRDGLGPLVPAIALAVVAVVRVGRRDGSTGTFCGALAAGMAGSSFLSAWHAGAYLNVWMPAHAAIALLAPLSITPFSARHNVPVLPSEPQASPASSAGGWVLKLALLVQFALLVYQPARAIPTAADRHGGEHFLAYLRATPGDVLVPQMRYLPRLAGKRSYGLGMAAEDVLKLSYPNEGTARLRTAIEEAIRHHRFAAIVLADPTPSPLLARYYRLTDTVFAPGDASYYPVTGARSRPDYVFTPK